MEAAPVEDSLEDEEVRAARGELDVRRPDDGPAVEVRRDLRVVRLGERRDLLALEDAAHPAEVRLQDPGGARREHAGELVLRRQPLPGRDRDRRRPGDGGHLLRHLGRDGLLEPEGIEPLEAAGQADRARCGELPVGAEEQVAAGADRLADRAHVRLAPVERLEVGLPGVERGVGAGGVELQRREATVRVGGRPLGRERRVEVDVRRVARLGVEVRVRPEPLVHPAAEQLVHRLPDRLADDVPAGDLDAAEHADE